MNPLTVDAIVPSILHHVQRISEKVLPTIFAHMKRTYKFDVSLFMLTRSFVEDSIDKVIVPLVKVK